MSIRLAMVACLDERRSVHTVTFKSAIALFAQFWNQNQNKGGEVSIELFDDKADADTAAQVAYDIVKWCPHAVIGHFSSAAAEAAAPIYAAMNIPLLLPAATARHLTQSATTYRICDHDDTYVHAIGCFCRRYDLRLDNIQHDGTVHGRSVANALRNQTLVSDQGKSCILFSGNCQHSIMFMAEYGGNNQTLLLTDDALAQEIIAPAQAYGSDVFIIGLTPKPQGRIAEQLRQAYQATYGAEPGCYFWETIAAMQIAVEACGGNLQEKTWSTVLGKLNFDEERELSPANFAAYRVTSAGTLEECEI
jgi:ABC-type branched-subunit amino acid transport system substrate-binding protein